MYDSQLQTQQKDLTSFYNIELMKVLCDLENTVSDCSDTCTQCLVHWTKSETPATEIHS